MGFTEPWCHEKERVVCTNSAQSEDSASTGRDDEQRSKFISEIP
jgi:hypothetical protein